MNIVLLFEIFMASLLFTFPLYDDACINVLMVRGRKLLIKSFRFQNLLSALHVLGSGEINVGESLLTISAFVRKWSYI